MAWVLNSQSYVGCQSRIYFAESRFVCSNFICPSFSLFWGVISFLATNYWDNFLTVMHMGLLGSSWRIVWIFIDCLSYVDLAWFSFLFLKVQCLYYHTPPCWISMLLSNYISLQTTGHFGWISMTCWECNCEFFGASQDESKALSTDFCLFSWRLLGHTEVCEIKHFVSDPLKTTRIWNPIWNQPMWSWTSSLMALVSHLPLFSKSESDVHGAFFARTDTLSCAIKVCPTGLPCSERSIRKV